MLPPTPPSIFSVPPRVWSPFPGVNNASWGQPQALRFADCGTRFAAAGEGGSVALWRLDAPVTGRVFMWVRVSSVF